MVMARIWIDIFVVVAEGVLGLLDVTKAPSPSIRNNGFSQWCLPATMCLIRHA